MITATTVQRQVTARHRSRIYREIQSRGSRGMDATFFDEGHAHAGTAEIVADLLADGWITAHESYKGDGKPWGTVYVATDKGNGERP